MASTVCRRVAAFTLLFIIPVLFAEDYRVPDVTIQALKPTGIRISIPDSSGMTLFVLHGRVNRRIEPDGYGSISVELTKPKNGFWTFQDNTVKLKVGDVIYYYVYIVKNGLGYPKDNLSYTVTELVDPNASAPSVKVTTIAPSSCRHTATIVRDGTACAGQIIFEDNFDNGLDEKWTIEQYIPFGPEFPFVSYQRPSNSTTVSIANGMLRIEPMLQENLPGFNDEAIVMNENKLDLKMGCTKPGACIFINKGSQIMPPIASGRITSLFAFKYGVVEIRAKLPEGDWIYPDLLLESFTKLYGADDYHSGIIRIAGALGNIELTKDLEEYGNKVLYGGPVMDFKCRTSLLSKEVSSEAWGNDFHVYSLRWAQDRITLFVDGKEWGRIEPTASGLKGRLPNTCEVPRDVLKTPMAPFDDFFHIVLGVAAGGISEFPDRTVSQNSIPKPWINSANKAKVNFFNDREDWKTTWIQPALLVDYVRVRAL